jgi:hypothetical protein
MWGSFRPAGYFKVQGDKGREITDRVCPSVEKNERENKERSAE